MSTPALQTERLSLSIGGAQILTEVDLTVATGEMIGVIGPNGAGKTTLFNLLSGIARPTAGRILLGGRDITGEGPQRRARRGLGRTFQTSSVFPALTVLENVRLAAQAAAGNSLTLWRRPRSDDEATEVAVQQLARLGLARRAETLAGSLSHGEQRKLELALLMATDASVILLDEPMAGASSGDIPELTELIGMLHREGGRTVLMVEHHMEVVLGLADRIAVLHHGALLACAPPDEVMADATVQQAYLGRSA